MNIRKAKLSDLKQIMPLVKDAVQFMNSNGNFQWDTEYPTQAVFENDIKKEQLFAVFDRDTIAGFVALNDDQPPEYLSKDWTTDANALVIHRMVVNAAYRGKGVARLMYQFTEEEARRQMRSAIRSDTNSKNGAMNHLFKDFKYRFTGTIVLRNNPDLFNCYEKNLK